MNKLEKEAKRISFLYGKILNNQDWDISELDELLDLSRKDGAEWQSKQSPWISVVDRLPDTDNGQSLYEVLVKMNDSRCYVAANIDVERLAEIGEVTHWMPIPE